MQTIKSGLIIYRSARYSTFSKKNVKYRRFPSRVVHYLRDFQTTRSTLAMKESYISKVAHSHIPDGRCDRNFLRLLTRTRSIQELTIVFSAIPWRTFLSGNRWEEEPEERRIKKIFRKVFVLCSKVQKFTLNIDERLASPHMTVPFPFKYLLIARSLKNFSCELATQLFLHFHNLKKYFACANRRGLKHKSCLSLKPDGDYLDFQHRDLEDFRKIVQEISGLSKNQYLKFDLYVEDEGGEAEFQETLTFSQIFSALENPFELAIHPACGHRLFQILKKVPNSAHLAKLDLELMSSENPNEHPLDHLADFLLATKSLSSLQLTLRQFEKSNALDSFIEKLKECGEISSLVLEFQDCSCADDSLFISLAKSLTSLPKLKNLALSFQAQYTFSGMKKFLIGIVALKNIEELDLSFQESLDPEIKGQFIALCKALKTQNRFRKLHLRMYDTKRSLIIEMISHYSKRCAYSQLKLK